MLNAPGKGHWPLLETEKISLGWETHRMRAIKLVTGRKGTGQADPVDTGGCCDHGEGDVGRGQVTRPLRGVTELRSYS